MRSNKPIMVASILGLVLLGIQFVPLDTTNPPIVEEIEVPAAVAEVLRESCYDCHSNETKWPWYSRVAPVSWLIAHDVAEAREHLNFSDWGRVGSDEQFELIEEIWEEVEEEEMPLWFYLPLHPEARLGDDERQILEQWTTARGSHGAGHDSSTGKGD